MGHARFSPPYDPSVTVELILEEGEFDLNALVYAQGIFRLDEAARRGDVHDVALVEVVGGGHLHGDGDLVARVALPPGDLGAEVRNAKLGLYEKNQAQNRERYEDEGDLDDVVLGDGVGNPDLLPDHDERVKHENVPGIGTHLIQREAREDGQDRVREIGEREEDRDQAREGKIIKRAEHEDIAQRKRPQHVGDEVDASGVQGFGLCHFSQYFSVDSRFP